MSTQLPLQFTRLPKRKALRKTFPKRTSVSYPPGHWIYSFIDPQQLPVSPERKTDEDRRIV